MTSRFEGNLWFHRWTPTLGCLSWTGTTFRSPWPKIWGDAMIVTSWPPGCRV